MWSGGDACHGTVQEGSSEQSTGSAAFHQKNRESSTMITIVALGISYLLRSTLALVTISLDQRHATTIQKNSVPTLSGKGCVVHTHKGSPPTRFKRRPSSQPNFREKVCVEKGKSTCRTVVAY